MDRLVSSLIEKEGEMTIEQRLARIHFFEVTPDLSQLSEKEREAMKSSVEAARAITDIYLQQASVSGKQLYEQLQARSDKEGKDLARYYMTQGTAWDEYDEDKPFVPGVGQRPSFGTFYPDGFTKEEWERWISQHQDQAATFEDPCTVIERQGSELVAKPYSEVYRDSLERAAQALRNAAQQLPEGHLKNFLQLRAQAFQSNDYFESELAWIDTNGAPFEVTIGPYESYFDKLLGLKAAFEAFVGFPSKEATEKLQRFSPAVPEFDLALSERFTYKPKGAAIPLEVVDDVFRGGEAAFGFQFMAYNLPNDRRVHELKGSKKVFSRTVMEAKFNHFNRPISERFLPSKDIDSQDFEKRLLSVMAHELCHGLGPTTVEQNGRMIPFETALGDLHHSLEEAKADMLGFALLEHFYKKGLITEDTLMACVVSEITDFVRSWQKSYTEAHSKGALMEYNWIREHNGVRYNTSTGLFEIDPERSLEAMRSLSNEFLTLQAAGNYDRAKAFIDRWGVVTPEIPGIVSKLSDLPVEVFPVYNV